MSHGLLWLTILFLLPGAFGHIFTLLFHFCMFSVGCIAVCLFSHANMTKRWPYLLALACFRIGEAAHPGPQSDNFVLGIFNPSGLKGKAPFIVSQLAQGDIWAVSETHLCHHALLAFRSGIGFASGPYKYCLGGHPVPAQGNRTHHAAWRGVATLSKHPTRHVPRQVPADLYESSRIMITTSLVQDVWVTGGVVYGEPESSSYPQQRAHNESLLHHAALHICNLACGPRYLAGDWNVAQHTLPAFELLDSAGFVDLQDLAFANWGNPIQTTCKHATRKDFCYVSRELASILLEVHVDHDIFPDHAVMYGVFRNLGSIPPRFVWPCPHSFPWPKHWQVDNNAWNNATGSADSRYLALWQHIEETATAEVPFPVPKRFRGRASVFDTRRLPEGKVSPPKQARRGDVQPHFLAASFRHTQWLRQTRRLQSYVRHVTAHGFHDEQACRVWGAIVRSTGFTPSFPSWWTICPHKTFGAPEAIPLCPPDAMIATAIFDSFALAFRAMEVDLQKASRLYARQRRESNPNAIFADLKTFQNQGVEVLLKTQPAMVTEVRDDENMVVLDRPIHFDQQCPLTCDGQPLAVIHAEHDAVWVEDCSNVTPGQTILQVRRTGTTSDLFELFLNTWKTMWERHTTVPPDRWNVILQFARRFLPRRSFAWKSMRTADLIHCIAHKRPATSAGLDGVTLQDLKALPGEALSNFVDMFHFAETTGSWPSQVLAGKVTCLPKKPDPGDALDFRPITVLGLLYRCWGTFQARQAIHALDELLPPGLFGSRPQCYAGQIWSQLLWSIEMAYETRMPLSGVVADIQKAFNCLPREVVMESCALIGLPFPVLTAWAGALASMPRRFLINGSLSPPAYSNCGLPEGCAMSCVGMIVIDMLFHNWMTHFFPLCQPISYVDDWQVLMHDSQQLDAMFACLERFTHSLDLQLDHRKTHMWSTCSSTRKSLRTHGFKLIASGRNLGAHVQFSRQHTNKSLMERIQAVVSLWPKLKLSACAYHQKVRALTCAAWPKALHGVAATTVSMNAFGTLRSGAMKGLKADKAGANPMVHLGLVEKPCTDPHAWAIMQTLRLARDCGRQSRVERVLAALAAGSEEFPANSITNTLLSRLQHLGWHVAPDGKIHDAISPFSLFEVSAAELLFRVEFQWPSIVATEVLHRTCFAGLDLTDPGDVRQWLSMHDMADQALFRNILNGTHFTQNGKSHCQEGVDDTCPFCNCSDSRFHRFWQCEHFAFLRKDVPADVLDAVIDLPEALTSSGWSLLPSTWLEWCQYFAAINEPAIPEPQFHTDVHLFTDGSCVHQKCPGTRFAGWAVIAASIHVYDSSRSYILDSGVVPGLLQSAVRAEIFAILRALQSTFSHRGTVHLWTDCEAVVKRFRRIAAGGQVKMNSLHADLWLNIQANLQTRAGRTCITRVAAHQNFDFAPTAFHDWCYRHNDMADRAAVQANFAREPMFWQLYHRHLVARAGITRINRAVQNVQLEISREVLRNQSPLQPESVLQPPELVEIPLPDCPWKPLPKFRVPEGATRWYGDAMPRLILSWFWLALEGTSEAVRWISHYQLYADFMSSTGHPGPTHLGRWEDGSRIPFLRLKGIAFRQRARWFTKMLKECLKHLQVPLLCAYGRPCSQVIQMHTGVIALPWPQFRLHQVDLWMYHCSGSTFRRQTRLIDALPYREYDDSFPPVYVSTAV